jgi:protein-S-isoprenylcysteine O-methyltransferase Ste14
LIAFGVLLALWILGEASLSHEDQPTGGTLAWPTGLLVLASQVAAVATAHAAAWGAAWGGAAVMAAGIALRLAAILALGHGFASALGSTSLVTSGPYRFARHPSELGLLGILFGGAWLVASPWAAGIAAAAVPLVVIRCLREDRALARHAGYAAWRRGVGWFAPRLRAFTAP